MDGSMIDRLATAIERSSRRQAMRTILGGVAAAMGSMAATGLGGKAKKKKKCKKKTCKALASGAACETNQQCCPNETNRICAFSNGMIPGPICCGTLGATCASFNECCGGFTCFEERCAFAG